MFVDCDLSSLRVNLDMDKTVYAHQIMNDAEIPNTIVRTSTLPEELGPVTNDDGTTTYQASSPDKVAIVTWTSTVG